MEIQFLGRSCFRIKGREVILVTNPFVKTFADIVTVSKGDQEDVNPDLVKGTKRRPQPFIVDAPGEYEISGVSILGRKSKETVIYIIDMDGLRLVHLGNLRWKLEEEQLEEINGVDVLFVPVEAAEVVSQVEPKIVVPMGYKSPDNFLKLMGVEEVKPVSKLLISKEGLPEERQVLVLDARS